MPHYLIVYEVDGWMGDIEWSEGLFRSEAKAQRLCDELWSTRSSKLAPSWTAGFCKFAVNERKVL